MNFAAIRKTLHNPSRKSMTEIVSASNSNESTPKHTLSWPLGPQRSLISKSDRIHPSHRFRSLSTRKKKGTTTSSKTASDYDESIFEASFSALSPQNKADTRETSIASSCRNASSGVLQSRYIMEEMINTERAFVRSLHLLQEQVLQPLLRRCKVQGTRCPPVENLSSLTRKLSIMHSSLLDLQGLVLINRISEILQDTQTYIQYYFNASLFSSLWRSEQSVFEKSFLEHISDKLKGNESKCDGSKLDLSVLSLVQKPMSRIVKYQLLVSSLSKANPKNWVINDVMQKIKDSLHQINHKVGEVSQCSEDEQILSTYISFEKTRGKCPQFYGRLKLAASASFGWPKYRRRWSLCKKQVFLLFFEQALIIIDYGTGLKKASPLLVLPYDLCELIESSKDYDGGLIDKSDESAKLRFSNGGCEFESLLHFSDYTVLKKASRIISSVRLQSEASGVECYLPASFASCDIRVENSTATREQYIQCYFKRVLECKMKVPSKRLSRSRFLRAMTLSRQRHKV